MRDDIQHILSGTSRVKYHHLIQTVCSYLKRSQGTSSMVENYQQHKEEETKRLIQFVNDHNLWVDNVNIELYVSQGAEQKVYLKDGSTVLKLNDAIYYVITHLGLIIFTIYFLIIYFSLILLINY